MLGVDAPNIWDSLIPCSTPPQRKQGKTHSDMSIINGL
jgi:hypothetical protein